MKDQPKAYGWGGCIRSQEQNFRPNRPFAASHSRGTQPPSWRTKVALGQDNQRKLPFKIMYVFCLSCPSATFALRRGGFIPGEWLATKGLLQPNFLKVRQVNITTLLITTLEDYRSQVLKDEIEQFNKLLTNMNWHGKEFHYSAVLMKYRH